jgi:hypothetical protein
MSYDFIQIYETSFIKRAYFKLRCKRKNKIEGFVDEIDSSVYILPLAECFRIEFFGFECLDLNVCDWRWLSRDHGDDVVSIVLLRFTMQQIMITTMMTTTRIGIMTTTARILPAKPSAEAASV